MSVGGDEQRESGETNNGDSLKEEDGGTMRCDAMRCDAMRSGESWSGDDFTFLLSSRSM